jgi:regulator of protease activity HflC (stomatin/prohibitin superfamily)
MESDLMEGFASFVLFLLVLAVVLVILGVKSVSQGMEFTVERFRSLYPYAAPRP